MWSLKIITIFLVTFAASAYAAPYTYDPSVDQPANIPDLTTTPCPPFDLKQKLDAVKEKVKEAGKAIGKTIQDVKLAVKNKLDKITGRTPPPNSPVRPPTQYPPTTFSPPIYYEETTVRDVPYDPYATSENYQPESGFAPSVPEVEQQPYSETVPLPDQPAAQSDNEQSQNADDVIVQPVDNFYRISGSKS